MQQFSASKDHGSAAAAVLSLTLLAPLGSHSRSRAVSPFPCVQVCVWVDSYAGGKDAKPSRSGPFCFDGPRQQLPIDGLEVGLHRCVRLFVQYDPRFLPVLSGAPSPLRGVLLTATNCRTFVAIRVIKITFGKD